MIETPADIPKYLWDAHRAAERIRRFTAGRTEADYLEDDMLQSAVERQFEIIGEALGVIRRIDPVFAATIPDIKRIIAFRNVLIHGYALIDNGLVWSVIEKDLAVLIQDLLRLLDGSRS